MYTIFSYFDGVLVFGDRFKHLARSRITISISISAVGYDFWCYFGAFVFSCPRGDVWASVRDHHSSYIFMAFSGFGCRSKHPMRSWDLIHVPNGVVRCGFGILFVGFVRI